MFVYEMTLYLESHIDLTKKLLDLISEFRKVAGYKINIEKSVSSLYTNNRFSKN